MRAVLCREYGPYQNISVEDVSAPAQPLAPGTVLVDVAAAGIGFANVLSIAGKHQNSPPVPFIPGTEAAGVIGTVAADVTRLRPGQRVAISLPHGAFAEQAVAQADNVFPIPDSLDFAAATNFPTIYATAYGALVWQARMQPGETLLVHGAGGGSGLAAVDVGKAMGATVIATAGDEAKMAAARSAGADHLINYRQVDFRRAVLDLTNGRGADVIFDPVGGEVFDQSLRCIAPEGRIFPIGFAGGTIPQIPANILLVKNISVHGIYWGYYGGWAKQPRTPEIIARLHGAMETMFKWQDAGRLHPLVHGAYDLADCVEALDVITQRRAIGKVVLRT
ncbi:MAG: NADPH:quinone oxidoreductase family protein [Alphaproteobacteria bacterium]|nr:NADPH:quinone oxidoreductase family protein [Alphaproteobacteria bacterium]